MNNRLGQSGPEFSHTIPKSLTVLPVELIMDKSADGALVVVGEGEGGGGKIQASEMMITRYRVKREYIMAIILEFYHISIIDYLFEIV